VTSGQNSLNSNHERRLAVTCRHVDKLLAEMEDALRVTESRLAFPQHVFDLSPAQRAVIEDRISLIRAQLVRALESLEIERPPADIPVSRSLHSHLTFVNIAVEELKPRYMRGYGEIPPAAAVKLNDVADELQHLVRQLDHYLMREAKEDLEERPPRLEPSFKEDLLRKKLECVIDEYGIGEFRSAVATILDRRPKSCEGIVDFERKKRTC